MRISSAGWSFERPCNFLTEHPSFLHYRCLTSRHFSRQPQPQERRRKIPGRILQQQCWSTVAKRKLAKNLRYKELWNKRHPALTNPKSRNEGKVHRIRLSAEPGKLHRQITCFYVFTTLALSTHGNHWRSAQLSHGTSSRLGQPAVLSNVNWARPRSV